MPDDRKKVGDVDPAGKKAFAAEMSSAGKPAASKPAAPASPGMLDTIKAAPRRVREILSELADAMDPDEPRQLRVGPDGKPMEDVLTAMETGIDDANKARDR